MRQRDSLPLWFDPTPPPSSWSTRTSRFRGEAGRSGRLVCGPITIAKRRTSTGATDSKPSRSAIDVPDQLLHASVGDRVPLGWDLEFESAESPESLADGYSQQGLVHGTLLGPHPPLDVEGPAIRRHWWGRPDGSSWHAVDRIGDLTGESMQRALVPTPAGVRTVDLTTTGLLVTATTPRTAIL